MTRKPKRVRCWMVTMSNGGRFITMFRSVASSYRPNAAITPGHFVPDEPKRKARKK